MADGLSPKSEIPGQSGANPRHVAIIMDGNGRWAAQRGLPRSLGHKRGSEAVKNAISAASKVGVEYLTLYAFSSENWSRPADEVKDLMGLLRLYLSKEVKELHKKGIRLRVIGRRERLDNDIVKLIDDAEQLTAYNQKLTLVIALSYGGRDEILGAVKEIAQSVQEGSESIDAIDEELFSKALSTKDIPDPDLMIRTSGEQRLSNFLLWQLAYTELAFLDLYWPDFEELDFIQAVEQFKMRDRRFGVRASG